MATMSWVRKAIDDAAAKSYEELYPTAYQCTTNDLDILWAICPNDVPAPVKQAVEAAVRKQAEQSSLTCAIIRLKKMGAYYATNPTRPDDPVGHFAIYLGTNPANTKLKSHLPTDCGMPTGPQPRPPGSAASKRGVPSSRAGKGHDFSAAEHEGTRTPSIREIEEEYGRLEERSTKPGRRLSKLSANLINWLHVK